MLLSLIVCSAALVEGLVPGSAALRPLGSPAAARVTMVSIQRPDRTKKTAAPAKASVSLKRWWRRSAKPPAPDEPNVVDSSTGPRSFSLPSLSLSSMPTFTSSASDAVESVEVATAEEPGEESPLAQLSQMVLGVVMAMVQLAVTKVQLVAMRQATSLQAYLRELSAELAATPQKLAANLKRQIYVMPFYMKAAAQIAYEDAEVQLQAFKAEAQRRIGRAPMEASAAVKAKLASAQVSAEEALERAIAAPDRITQSVSAQVSAELAAAKAQVDDLMGKAKAKRDELLG